MTDPQIHTKDGKSYGVGNLGFKGMALFFSTHRCNAICKHLKLEEVPGMGEAAPDDPRSSSMLSKVLICSCFLEHYLMQFFAVGCSCAEFSSRFCARNERQLQPVRQNLQHASN